MPLVAAATAAPRDSLEAGNLRLATLTNLRWMAIGGQSAALLFVHFALGFPVPILACAVAIAASVALNLMLAATQRGQRRLTDPEAALYLGFDIAQLAVLLYMTGGITNPFSVMFVAPVVIAATSLRPAFTMTLGALAFTALGFLALQHLPLPWGGEQPAPGLPQLYLTGMWAAVVLSVGFTAAFAWRNANEASRMSAALAATRIALAKEQRLSALGALAAATAHELGTPLGTIAVVARELERDLPEGSAAQDDARLLRAQAERCREILGQLANHGGDEDPVRAIGPMHAVLEEIAAPYRGLDVEIEVFVADSAPFLRRRPELVHALGNLIENAADFARQRVRIYAAWNEHELRIVVQDDGPGFDPDVLTHLGEPYVTTRPGYDRARGEADILDAAYEDGDHPGMGLGYFIAKTLLERTGGTVEATNALTGGGRVNVIWPRGAIDDADAGRAKAAD